ncbi:MAG TPA: FixH family protein [Alphaproteobacteria bacterium]
MSVVIRGRSAAARCRYAVLAALLALPFVPAMAAPQDYRFELAGPPAKLAHATLVNVRLVHVPDGKPVPGAVIVQSKFDMGPDGMAEMGGSVKALPATEPGVYRFEAQPSMPGNWGLTLSARVQGEPQAVRGTVTVPVPK